MYFCILEFDTKICKMYMVMIEIGKHVDYDIRMT